MQFTEKELKLLKKLNTPAKIQEFINKIPINFEDDGQGESCMSPVNVLRKDKCHCIEGAFLAAFLFWFNKIGSPLVLDMHGTKEDYDHVIAVFQDKKTHKWGAISKSNHAVLRYREPVYRDIHELVMSYFHEYSDDDGNKTLREFSESVDLRIFGKEWVTNDNDLWYIHDYLDSVKHFGILTKVQVKNLKKQDSIEIKTGEVTEYKRKI